MRFRIARAAARDLEEIGDVRIARHDPDVAERFTAELEAKARQIVEMPFVFPSVGTSGRGLRKRSHRRYIIYYSVGRTALTIVRVPRHSRDQTALLRKP